MTKQSVWFLLDIIVALSFSAAIMFSDSINPFLFTWFSGFDCGYVLVRTGSLWEKD